MAVGSVATVGCTVASANMRASRSSTDISATGADSSVVAVTDVAASVSTRTGTIDTVGTNGGVAAGRASGRIDAGRGAIPDPRVPSRNPVENALSLLGTCKDDRASERLVGLGHITVLMLTLRSRDAGNRDGRAGSVGRNRVIRRIHRRRVSRRVRKHRHHGSPIAMARSNNRSHRSDGGQTGRGRSALIITSLLALLVILALLGILSVLKNPVVPGGTLVVVSRPSVHDC